MVKLVVSFKLDAQIEYHERSRRIGAEPRLRRSFRASQQPAAGLTAITILPGLFVTLVLSHLF